MRLSRTHLVLSILTIGATLFATTAGAVSRQTTPARKGKKGLISPAKKVEPKKPGSSNIVTARKVPPAPAPVVPRAQAQTIASSPVSASSSSDSVDVIEYRPPPAKGTPASSNVQGSGGVYGISNRRITVEIDSQRVIQIQNSLKERGFYLAEPSGVYDDETIAAMKAFQLKERIDATGYPTAHALKRLGLSN